MTTYILRRLVLMIPVAFLVTIGVFALARLSPADPVLVFAGEERDPAALAAIRKDLGLDQPVPVQYIAWLTRAVQGDLGRSFQNKQKVSEAILSRRLYLRLVRLADDLDHVRAQLRILSAVSVTRSSSPRRASR